MNLELIKKYEKEFLHMLHGGKLMFKPNDKQVWFDSVTSPIDWTVEGLYVIDDEYCIYRIALAEGRTVEVYATYGLKVLDEQPWRRFAIGCSTFDLPVECYRIKPEEPKFKAGDWVTHIEVEKPWQITDNSLKHLDNRDLIKWEPKGGEVCIFWDTRGSHAIIDTFRYKTNNKYHTENTFWDNCMPFTGVLPPHIKDNK